MARRNPLSLLATAVALSGFAVLARGATDGGASGQRSSQDPAECVEPGCEPVRTVQASLGTPVVTLEERDACRDTAYLCRGLEWKETCPADLLSRSQMRDNMAESIRKELTPEHVDFIVDHHREAMTKMGYLSPEGELLV